MFHTRSDRTIGHAAMGRIEKTVFISYRRADGPWALAIFQDLTQHGYDVFIDYAGIASGNFESAILENIKARAHFLVLLTPTALERSGDPEDWMRREIEAALDNRRNIVPLMLEGFDFATPAIATQLTGKLVELKKYNGLEIPSARFFSSEMERLRNKFLNVEVDAVLHRASDSAQQTATEQKDKATKAVRVSRRSREAVREILIACYRRAIFTRTHAQINMKAMYASLSDCRSQLQRKIMHIDEIDQQRLVAGIIGELDLLERHRDNWGGTDIDGSKLRIIRALNELAKAARLNFVVPISLTEEFFDSPEDAGKPPNSNLATDKSLSVSLDTVLHPASDSAQQVAKEQKDKATMALGEAPRQPWLSPEERRKQEETAAQRWLLPLIGAGGACLMMLLLMIVMMITVGYGAQDRPLFPVFLMTLYGGIAGMLIQRLGIVKALAIPVIPGYLLILLGSMLAGATISLAEVVLFAVVGFGPGAMGAWLAFWVHSLWARRHQMTRGPSTENSPDVP